MSRLCPAVSPGASVGPPGPGAAASPLTATRWRERLAGVREGGPREEFSPRGSRDHSHLPLPADRPATRHGVYGGCGRVLGSGKLAVGGSTVGRPLSGCPGSPGQLAHRMTLGRSRDLTLAVPHL